MAFPGLLSKLCLDRQPKRKLVPPHSAACLGRGRVKSEQDEDMSGELSVEWGDQGSLGLEHGRKDWGGRRRQAKEGTGQLLNSIKICMPSPALDLGYTEINKAGLLAPQAHKQAQKQAHKKMAKTVEWAELCGLICLARVGGSPRSNLPSPGTWRRLPRESDIGAGL